MDAPYWPPFSPEGKLEELPLPVLMTCILDEKLSGNLHIESGDEKAWIHFDEGFPAGVHSPKSQDYLGSILRELNLIDDNAFNQSLMQMAKTNQLQGEVLMEMGAIDGEQLEQALSLQLARKLARLFAVKAGTFRFAEDEELPPPMEAIRINPYALIYNGIKNYYKAEDMKKHLGVLMGKSCKVSGLYVERKELFELPPEDLKDAELLREFRLPQEFTRRAKGGATSAMMLLTSLLCCGMIELEEASFAVPFGRARRPPARPADTAPPRPATAAAQHPAAGPSPQASAAGSRRPGKAAKVPADLVKKVNEKFEQVRDADLWRILEVEKGADVQTVKKSFISLAKVYHPDRIAGSADEELIHRMSVIAARLNEAHTILTDSQKRQEYEASSADSPASKEKRTEEARVLYQKAQVFIKKNALQQAAEAIRWAVDLDETNGDYQAYRVWLDYLRDKEGTEQERARRHKDELLLIAKKYKESFPAFQFLSRLYKKLDDNENYGRVLKIAYKLNPKDVEIARELRLYNSRKEKEDKRGRFLGIKFKK